MVLSCHYCLLDNNFENCYNQITLSSQVQWTPALFLHLWTIYQCGDIEQEEEEYIQKSVIPFFSSTISVNSLLMHLMLSFPNILLLTQLCFKGITFDVMGYKIRYDYIFNWFCLDYYGLDTLYIKVIMWFRPLSCVGNNCHGGQTYVNLCVIYILAL